MPGYHGSVRAPEFPGGMDWLNVDGPLSIHDLRGKIVLLDFWTYCCINCMHVIPELRKLEEHFPETLVVIGVHAPKYSAERSTENVRHALLRYGIQHPVVNDPDHVIWDEYAISAWPTTVLIDPKGYVIGVQPGEFEADAYAQTISAVESEFQAEGTLSRSPLKLLPEVGKSESPLLYPGKVLVDSRSNRIFIADSSHNRIVVTKAGGSVLQVIGDGERGFVDGSFSNASLNRPQGMALDGDLLYVADTENHAIRRVDLAAGSVRTVAGTGRQSRLYRQGGEALETDLSSPWDLALRDGLLYVAMAGSHQIWTIDLHTNEARRAIGTGREALGDGTLERSALAQTSGLSLFGDDLFFADSETSSIRVAHLSQNRVETIVGAGLFDFGDIDGGAGKARLQHCLGVAYYGGRLYVADSYNNKIKVLNLADRTTRTLFGDGTPGFADGSAQSARFWEPGGISAANGTLFIADTNNHAIRLADLKTEAVRTLSITGL